MVVAIAEAGKPVWSEAFGHAHVETGRAATVDTPYSLASITKPMMGSLLMSLREQGRIDLDRPANDYLAQAKLRALRGDARDATVARLANHTAGLPLHYQFFFDGDPDRPPGYDETIRRYGNIITPPGEAYTYSNVGYGILGSIAERVGGDSLRSLFHNCLFAPLGMENSFFEPTADQFAACAARYDGEGVKLPYYVTDHPAASEAFASAEDLLRFGIAHLADADCPILTRDSMHLMRIPAEIGRARQAYGVGWGLSETEDGLKVLSHSGGMDGVSTSLLLVPDRGIVMVVLCNKQTARLSEVLDVVCQAVAVRRKAAEQAEKTFTPMSLDLQRRWVGEVATYAGTVPIELDLPTSTKFNGQSVEFSISMHGDRLGGSLEAEIPTPDARRTDHRLLLNLDRIGDKLLGCVTAQSKPGPRIGNALSYPARLTAS